MDKEVADKSDDERVVHGEETNLLCRPETCNESSLPTESEDKHSITIPLEGSDANDGSKSELSKMRDTLKDTATSDFKMPAFGPKAGAFKIKSSLPSSVNVLKLTETKKSEKKQETSIASQSQRLSEQESDSKLQTDNDSSNKEDDKSRSKEKITQRNERLKVLSPAEQLKQATITIPYKEPPWGGGVDDLYCLEILKNGQIIGKVDLTAKSFHVFGRLPSCDITMEHPSISRHHAVIQHCAVENEKYPVGWYLYDLDSTHGTWVNKAKLKPNVYYRLRVGHVLKFGGSTRLYIMEGPEMDQDEESEMSITEMKQMKEKQKKTAEILQQAAAEQEELEGDEEKEDEGCGWGIDTEDAVDPDQINPFAVEANALIGEELDLDDPKKTLRGWFEREGYDLPEYEAEEVGFGKHRCRLELPLDTTTGEPIIAEAVVSGKKKEAVVACALEACRILDRHGVLRQAQHESRKRKKKNWEEDDFYDSDEDTFLDRTGTIEKKRQERMKRAGVNDEEAATYQSLVDQLEKINKEIQDIEEKLEKAKAEKNARDMATEEDALDAYMTAIKSGAMDTKTKIKLKSQLFELRKEEQKLHKLANLARPASLPELKKPVSVAVPGSRALPMFGKMKGRGIRLPVIGPSKSAPQPRITSTESNSQMEEEEEDENEEGNTVKRNSEKQEKAITHKDINTSHEETPSPNKDSGKLTDEKMNASIREELEKGLSRTVNNQSQISEDKMVVEMTVDQDVSMSEGKTPNKRQMKTKETQKSKKREKVVSKDYCDDDPDYAVWVPPTGQSGDGRTHLNDKYGY